MKSWRPTDWLAAWLIVQLLLVGAIAGAVQEQVATKTYDCQHKPIPFLVGLAVPILFLFHGVDQKVAKYCEGK